MVRMPIKTFAVSAALALAMVIFTVPLGGAVQAASPMHGWMLHDGGSMARFEPNELPDPFVRDFDGDCEWWRYELHNGHYVRTYTPCRYGDQEVSYRKNTHQLWGQSTLSTNQPSETAAVSPPSTGEALEAPASTAGKLPAPGEVGTATDTEETDVGESVMESAELDTEAAEAEAAEEVTIEATPEEAPTVDIVDTLVQASDFAALLAAEGATDMVDTLRSEGPYTLFAPNDEAFAALPEGSLENLMADASGELTQILQYHVVVGVVTSDELTDGAQLETMQGGVLTVTMDGDSILINGANLIYPDIETTNGVIHVIDAVLVPATE